MKNTPTKIFIIGLPRTGTTSLCASFLSLGYKVAHTAYTEHAFKTAQVIADTPIFYAYPHLDKHYPDAKYIYLTRSAEQWIPSIKNLLNRMYKNVVSESGGFNPMIKAAYTDIFSPYTFENINNNDFLEHCYQRHEQSVLHYFRQRKDNLLRLDLTSPNAWQELCRYIGVNNNEASFPHLNVNGKVTAWNDIKHPLKVPSTHKGKIDKLTFMADKLV